MAILTLTLIFLVFSSYAATKNHSKFPSKFLFGVATSAYQIEGAWNEDGKGEHIWDTFVHETPSPIMNGDTGDVACDSYYKYREDVELAGSLGVQHYRFSVSWSRILPTGSADVINQKGISYYQSLVDGIVDNKMIPIATIYHWDLPQPLQDIGGWNNVSMVEYFVNYARIVISILPKVGYWITFNEPKQICMYGYGTDVLAPAVNESGRGDYLCAYVLLKSHAEVYHMYKNEFSDYEAKMSLTVDGSWSEPASSSSEDVEAAERANQFQIGIYANPVYNGNWPEVVIQRVGERSKHQNLSESRLPAFSQEEIDRIKGTFDFMGFNSYTTEYIANAPEQDYGIISYATDLRVMVLTDPNWKKGANGVAIVPWGMRKILNWLKYTYNDPDIFITENGVADSGTYLDDDDRIEFISEYLHAILDAMNEDGVSVFGYTIWAFIDNFEWIYGYSVHFGLFHIDFMDPNRTRVPKKSSGFYTKIATTHRIPKLSNYPQSYY